MSSNVQGFPWNNSVEYNCYVEVFPQGSTSLLYNALELLRNRSSNMMDYFPNRSTVVDLGLIVLAGWLIYSLYQVARTHVKTTKLRGPPSTNFFFGVGKETIGTDDDPATLYERWMDKYGSVYQIPEVAGAKRTVICDPKAIAHFNSMETFGYTQAPEMKRLMEFLVRLSHDVLSSR